MDPLDPADARELRLTSKPPSAAGAEIEQVRDVLIVPTLGSGSFDEYRAHPPAGEPPFDLGRGVVIRHPITEESELVFNACAPRGHYFFPARQFSARFAYDRAIDREAWQSSFYTWDSEHVLTTVLALSRFVRDNAHDVEYAARIVEYSDGQRQVIPGAGYGSRGAYRLRSGYDWLDTDDAAALRDLIEAYYEHEPGLPERIRRALWLTDRVSGESYLDVALPLLVTTAEALTNTSRRDVVLQFVTRLPLMAADVGADGLDTGVCRELYEARSQASHGNHVPPLSGEAKKVSQGADQPRPAPAAFVAPPPDALAKVAALQSALRSILRTAIEDPAFASHFASAESIRARWPVTIVSRPAMSCGVTCSIQPSSCALDTDPYSQ